MLYYWLLHIFKYLSFRDFIACSKVCKSWQTAAANKNLPQSKIEVPISTADLGQCSRKMLGGVTILDFYGNFVENSTMIRAFPYLVCLERLNLCNATIPAEGYFLKRLSKDIMLLPFLKYLDLSNCRSFINFCYVQQLAHSRTGFAQVEIRLDNTQFVSYGKAHETQITFCNSGNARVDVWWLDFSGKPVKYATLSKGFYTQATFKTHPWIITNVDNPSKVLLRTVGMSYPQLVKIDDVLPYCLIPVPQILTSIDRAPTPHDMTIHNSTKKEISLNPINKDGMEMQRLKTIPPNTKATIHTNEGKPWIISMEGAREPLKMISALAYIHISIGMKLKDGKQKLYLTHIRTY